MGTHFIERMVVEVDGAGPPVVMLHGLGATSNVWTPQIDAIISRHRVIRPDLPGSGRSVAAGEQSVDQWVARVVALLKVLGVRRAHFVGHSMGTIVCQHIAAKFPEMAGSLMLLGPLRAPPEAARDALRARAHSARRDGMSDIAEQVITANLAVHTRSHNPLGVALVRELLMRQDADGYAATCEALASAEAADLKQVAQPTLLMTGDEDPVAPASTMYEMCTALSDAREMVLRQCGHWASIEKVDDVNRELVRFLARAR